MNIRNERGIAFVFVGLIMAAVCTVYMKSAEAVDHVIHAERYKTQDHIVQGQPGAPGAIEEWREKLNIETNDKHDSNSLPPGVTVDTGYKGE